MATRPAEPSRRLFTLNLGLRRHAQEKGLPKGVDILCIYKYYKSYRSDGHFKGGKNVKKEFSKSIEKQYF